MSSPEKILDKSLVKQLNENIVKNNPNITCYRKLEILGKIIFCQIKVKILK